MLYEEFAHRLKNLCLALGFSAGGIGDGEGRAGNSVPEFSWRWTEEEEAVIFLSCRVRYNPNWGEYCGHPQLLVRAETGEEAESPAAFIAPYLQQFRFAQEHVFLTADGRGEYYITLPASLLGEAESSRPQLIVELAKVAQTARPEREAALVPARASGPMRSFLLSDAFRRELEAQNFAWIPGRSVPIGRYLESHLFTFAEDGDATDRDSLFATILLPCIREIVAHPTPNLRAAEIHLDGIFTRTLAALDAEYHQHNILCLAGLDVDMSTFIGRREHCIVPWRACLARRGEALFLEQDDLFVRLMAGG